MTLNGKLKNEEVYRSIPKTRNGLAKENIWIGLKLMINEDGKECSQQIFLGTKSSICWHIECSFTGAKRWRSLNADN